ncbi:MAG: putative N-glycosylase/DNA lyase [Deltaproteobacteria bacterium]|jgi:N-glycosylase/DNA lyase|nr:MAG: putative N-glycosylase/DNA lyase [Deltaproteobacteria bacterium]
MDYRELLKARYEEKKALIEARLNEFREVWRSGDDRRIFEELVFCILSSAVGPKVAETSLDAIADVLIHGSEGEIFKRLSSIHRYPEKASYIVTTREYFRREFGFRLRELISSFRDPLERRDFFALNKNIKGIGYTQASHFLRNIGFFGYAILDKHIVRSLYEFGVIESPRPPSTRKRYLEVERRFKEFALEVGISPDELDLLLWSEKTGHIPR